MPSKRMPADLSGCDAHGGWVYELQPQGSAQLGGRCTQFGRNPANARLLRGVVCSL